MAAGIKAKQLDADTKAIIYEGASLSQLATIFGMDNREVGNRIRAVIPCGERLGYPIYQIKDAAPVLVPPKGDLEGAIRKMSPKDLPPALTKEFWSAQKSRVEFEEMQGDLWRTADVIECLAEVAKNMTMSIKLMEDRLARNTQLTDRQRDIVRKLSDDVLKDISKNLIERFEHEPKRKFDEYGSPVYNDVSPEDDEL